MAGTETPETGPGVTYQGYIVIEWPEPAPGRDLRSLVAWKCVLIDALSGKPFNTCRKIEVHADASYFITADLTMFADEEGRPIFDGGPVIRDGKAIEGTFPFLVAEMRVRPAEPPRTALEPTFLAAEPCAS